MPFFKESLRLPLDDYIGRRVYFVTICTENRATFFSDSETGRWLIERLLKAVTKSDFTLHAYCLMPDHLHFVAEGLRDTCDLIKFVDTFKQGSAFEFSQRRGMRLWRRRYYDHVLRPSEIIEDSACYVWWNPVRKGLCADPKHYTQTLDWMNRSAAPTKWIPPWKRAQRHPEEAR